VAIKRSTGSAWDEIDSPKVNVSDGSDWKLVKKGFRSTGSAWDEIYAGTDQRTFAIPATYSRSFRSSSGGATGTWITNGFTNGQNAIRQGKFGGQGAYSTLGTNPFTGSQFITSCYPNTYGWVGVIEFSGTGTIYDITDGWSSATTINSSSLATQITERPSVKGTPKLHLQRPYTSSYSGQTGGEGFSTASGDVIVAEYNASIQAGTPSLASISTSNQVVYDPGGSWLSRGEKFAVNLTSTIIGNIKDASKNIALYAETPVNTNDDGLRDPDNHGGGTCAVGNTSGFTAAASQPNYVWFYDYTTGAADNAGSTVSGPWLEVQLDYA
jgi:hypothetical protein